MTFDDYIESLKNIIQDQQKLIEQAQEKIDVRIVMFKGLIHDALALADKYENAVEKAHEAKRIAEANELRALQDLDEAVYHLDQMQNMLSVGINTKHNYSIWIAEVNKLIKKIRG